MPLDAIVNPGETKEPVETAQRGGEYCKMCRYVCESLTDVTHFGLKILKKKSRRMNVLFKVFPRFLGSFYIRAAAATSQPF